MNGKAEKLKGRGRLLGPGIDADVPYELSHLAGTADRLTLARIPVGFPHQLSIAL